MALRKRLCALKHNHIGYADCTIAWPLAGVSRESREKHSAESSDNNDAALISFAANTDVLMYDYIMVTTLQTFLPCFTLLFQCLLCWLLPLLIVFARIQAVSIK